MCGNSRILSDLVSIKVVVMNYVKIYGKLEEGLELECGLGKIEPTFKTSVTISEKIKKSSTYFSFCHLLIIIFEKSSTLVQK